MYESMAEFRSLFGPNLFRSTSKEYYKWKLSDNPYLPGHMALEHRNGSIIGSTTITPKRIAAFGNEFLGAELGDAFTSPEYREKGVFSKVVNECTEYAISHGVDIIYATPNQRNPTLSTGAEERLGYSLCPFVSVKMMYKYVQAHSLETRFIKKFKSIILSKLLARTYFQYLYFRTHRREIRFQKQDKIYQISLIDRFNGQLDALWGSARKNYVFFTVRDNAYLKWRFFKNPDDYVVFSCTSGEDYIGYMVTKLSRIGGTVVGTICDFATDRDRLEIFYALIRKSEETLKRAGVQYIQTSCAENSPYFQGLINLGYIARGNIPGIIIFTGTEIGKRILETRMKWHFTRADSDTI